MANAGEVPESLRWGHGGLLSPNPPKGCGGTGQASIGYQVVVIEGDVDVVGRLR